MTPSASFKDEVMAPPGTSGGVKLPMAQLLIAVGFAVVLSVAVTGGCMYWLAHSGRLPVAAVGTAAKAPAAPAPDANAKTHALVLEPILANLADSGGGAYLRVSITLRVFDPPAVKGEKPKEKEEKPEKGKGGDPEEAAVRDAALQVIGQCTAQQLLEPNGKERLKHQLGIAIAQLVPQLKVKEIFFTEFLVQQ